MPLIDSGYVPCSVAAIRVRHVEHWQPVEFTGPDDCDDQVYEGYPGRVIDLGLLPHEVGVGFVNGPTEYRSPGLLRPLTEAQYLERGRRLVALQHPLRDEGVERFNASGHEWIDGVEPTP